MPILLCAAVSAHAQSLDAFKQRLAEPTPGATLFNRAQVTVTEHTTPHAPWPTPRAPGSGSISRVSTGSASFRTTGLRRATGLLPPRRCSRRLSRREGLRGLRDSLFHRFGGQLPDQGGGHHAQGACVGDLPEGFSQAAEEGEIPDFQPFGPIKVRFRKIILFSLLFPGEYLTLQRYGTINN